MPHGSKPYVLGAYHIADNRTDFEPQRTNNFEVQITGLDGLRTVENEKGIMNEADASRYITLSVATYAAPQINISTIPVSYGNNKIKFAGSPEFPDSNVVLNDYIGIDVEQILTAWQKLVYDPMNETIGLAKDYKKEAYLIEYTPDGTSYREWKLVGCWPSALQFGDFNQEGGNIRQITMTLTYDYAYPLDGNG